MGDRGNVVMLERRKEKVGMVYLYTHWGGYDLPVQVQAVLMRRERWTDGSYLARMIAEVVKPDGIQPFLDDNEHPLIIVDCEEQRIALAAPPEDSTAVPIQTTSWTFEEYCALDLLSKSGRHSAMPTFYPE